MQSWEGMQKGPLPRRGSAIRHASTLAEKGPRNGVLYQGTSLLVPIRPTQRVRASAPEGCKREPRFDRLIATKFKLYESHFSAAGSRYEVRGRPPMGNERSGACAAS
jgi:hypothetical protein